MKTTRREFLGMAGFAVGTAALFSAGGLTLNAKEPINRPPGVLDEDEFLSKCMRCKQCIYICQSAPEAGKVLQPLKLSDGLNVVNTPVRIEADGHKCTACGLCKQVCPSGAIGGGEQIVPQVAAEICVGCFKCVAACPAQALSEGENGYPALNADLCTACGTCVTTCETEGQAASVALQLVPISQLVALPEGNLNRQAPQVLADLCAGCFKCVTVCPQGALSQGANGYPALDVDKCIGCGDCVAECEANGQGKDAGGNKVTAIKLVPASQLEALPETNANAKKAHVIEADCQKCGKRPCQKACQYDAITSADKDSPSVVDPDKCVGCGECAAACPFEAIELV